MQGVAAHWEAAPPRADHGQCQQQRDDVERFHISKGYRAGTAYNFLVCQHGGVFVGRGWGTPSGANGTSSSNANFFAVCYMSGPGYPFTDAAKGAFRRTLESAPAPHDWRPHSSFVATACPGDEIRAWLAAGAPGGGGPAPRPRRRNDMHVIVIPNRGLALVDGGVIKAGLTMDQLGQLKVGYGGDLPAYTMGPEEFDALLEDYRGRGRENAMILHGILNGVNAIKNQA
jgi:hypothetical protein